MLLSLIPIPAGQIYCYLSESQTSFGLIFEFFEYSAYKSHKTRKYFIEQFSLKCHLQFLYILIGLLELVISREKLAELKVDEEVIKKISNLRLANEPELITKAKATYISFDTHVETAS